MKLTQKLTIWLTKKPKLNQKSVAQALKSLMTLMNCKDLKAKELNLSMNISL